VAALEKEKALKRRKIGITIAKRNSKNLNFDEGLKNWSNHTKPHQKQIRINKTIRALGSDEESN
jgi:hypothetical protein